MALLHICGCCAPFAQLLYASHMGIPVADALQARPGRLLLGLRLGLLQDASLQQLAVVLDDGRLGAWVNGAGGWLWADVSCMPSRPGATTCDTPGPPASGQLPGLR